MITLKEAEQRFEEIEKVQPTGETLTSVINDFIVSEINKHGSEKERKKVAFILSLAKWKVSKLLKKSPDEVIHAVYSLDCYNYTCGLCYLFHGLGCAGCPLVRCGSFNSPWYIAVDLNDKQPLIQRLEELLEECDDES